MKRSILLSLATATLLCASAYRIPEQSADSIALSGAYIANSSGADASYYNPANMVFNPDMIQVQADLTYIGLNEISYTDTRNPAFNSTSKSESFIVPTLFYSSEAFEGIRYGLSLTAPGGLSKRWEDPYAKTFAQEFTLKIVEFNPVIAYRVSETFAVAGGIRIIYSDGKVKSNGTGIGRPAIRDMEGDTTEFGYNLALAYKPISALNISATYRSNVDIKEEGNAKLYLSGTKLYDGGASVQIPLPAVAAVAVAYTYQKTTIELEYDRTYWSEYKTLDFQYKDAVPMVLRAFFDDPIPKNWEDTDAFRIGLTHQYSDRLKLMAGFAIDESPIPENTLNFELPDSDAMIYSAGFDYRYSDKLGFTMGILYDKKDERTVHNSVINGTFKDASALLVSAALRYLY
ncbi:MAG: hypothetical protein B6D59_04180 [Campylobacteraceae bacterium 4484_4]|nr:MAG: hypothetical protein B6D59_04180 [Campylobacteraceae bacterium 4484_4]